MIKTTLRGKELEIPVHPATIEEHGTCYVGFRTSPVEQLDDPYFFVIGPRPEDVRKLNHHCLHSPTGMEWGYGGSGPADLALSILVDFLREQAGGPTANLLRVESAARELHQAFKWDYVARLPRDRFAVPVSAVRDWLRKHVDDALTSQETRQFLAEVLDQAEKESGPDKAAVS